MNDLNDFDLLETQNLDGLALGVVELDRDGRVVRYNLAEARRARLTRWQVIGRDFVRELGWTIGAPAAARVRAFLATPDTCVDATAGEVRLRGRSELVDLTLVRGRVDHVYVVIRQVNA